MTTPQDINAALDALNFINGLLFENVFYKDNSTAEGNFRQAIQTILHVLQSHAPAHDAVDLDDAVRSYLADEVFKKDGNAYCLEEKNCLRLGMPVDARTGEIYEILKRFTSYLAPRLARSVPENKKFESWFLFDGDEIGLNEFLESIEWDWFTKGKKDRTGMFVIFLQTQNGAVGAVRCQSQKNYQKLLDILRRYDAAPQQKQGE